MRIIRLKIDKEVKKYLRHLSREFRVDDPGWTEDLFAMIRLKGSGLPSQQRISAIAKAAAKRKTGVNEFTVNLLVSKRKMLFTDMTKLPYFGSLCMLPDPINAVTRLMTNMRKMYAKTRMSQCVTCKLKPDCTFGKQYGDAFRDITKVQDPDYELKTHKDCPVLPETRLNAQFVEALRQFAQMVKASQNTAQKTLIDASGKHKLDELAEQVDADAQPDVTEDDDSESAYMDDDSIYVEDLPHTQGNRFDGRLDGNALCKVSEDFIDRVSTLQLNVFELGKRFSEELVANKKGKFSPTPNVDKDKSSREIEKESDLPLITPSQHGLPDEVFEARLEKKKLDKTQYSKPEDKKKLLYLLIDISGSMGSQFGSAMSSSLFTRNSLATLFSSACAKRVREDGGIVFCRFFAGAPDGLISARTGDEYDFLLNMLALPSCTGGSTNIPSAITTALRDIADAKDELSDAELLMITDCEDHVDVPAVKAALKGRYELNILDVAGVGVSTLGYAALRSIATRYYKADQRNPDITKMVSLL